MASLEKLYSGMPAVEYPIKLPLAARPTDSSIRVACYRNDNFITFDFVSLLKKQTILVKVRK